LYGRLCHNDNLCYGCYSNTGYSMTAKTKRLVEPIITKIRDSYYGLVLSILVAVVLIGALVYLGIAYASTI